jgi:hypothetical protein
MDRAAGHHLGPRSDRAKDGDVAGSNEMDWPERIAMVDQ